MAGKRPLNSKQNEPEFTSHSATSSINTNRSLPLPAETSMHYSAAAAAMGQLDQSYAYDSLFPQLLHPGSTCDTPFYNLMEQSTIPPHYTHTPAITLPWGGAIPQQPFQPQAGPSQYHPMISMGVFPFYGLSDTEQGPTTQQPQPQGTPDMTGHSPITPEEELEEAEEKRRRNTAASARFRVKKKHRTIALERSVTDLTGRAEELEREVSDLRRENGWLKEIVLLKGAQFAASNQKHQDAQRQAAALANVTDGQLELPPAKGGKSEKQLEQPEG